MKNISHSPMLSLTKNIATSIKSLATTSQRSSSSLSRLSEIKIANFNDIIKQDLKSTRKVTFLTDVRASEKTYLS